MARVAKHPDGSKQTVIRLPQSVVKRAKQRSQETGSTGVKALVETLSELAPNRRTARTGAEGNETVGLRVPRVLAYAAELASRFNYQPHSVAMAALLTEGDPMEVNLRNYVNELRLQDSAAGITMKELWSTSNAQRLALLAVKAPQMLIWWEKVFLDELHGDDRYWKSPATDESVFPPRRNLVDMNFEVVDQYWERIVPANVKSF